MFLCGGGTNGGGVWFWMGGGFFCVFSTFCVPWWDLFGWGSPVFGGGSGGPLWGFIADGVMRVAGSFVVSVLLLVCFA